MWVFAYSCCNWNARTAREKANYVLFVWKYSWKLKIFTYIENCTMYWNFDMNNHQWFPMANIAKVNRLDKPQRVILIVHVSTANSSIHYLYYCFQLSNLVCVKRKICLRGMHIIMRMQVATIVLQFHLIATKSHIRIYYSFAQRIFTS